MGASTSSRPFTWGVGTSAYQIEGAIAEDGKGPSIWDRFAAEGRTVPDGNIACDHYHRLESDLDLIADLGVKAYRFSVSWPRVIPDGSGEVNPPGLDFYDRLVDGLLERGIQPWATLYHWDLPASLQDRGGWADRETAGHFSRYAGVVTGRLGDRVTHWITQNEPWVAAFLGHLFGVFAPGLEDWETALRAGHNLLLSHGLAVAEIKSRDPAHQVGIALDCRPSHPASDSDEDVAAATHFDGFRNRWFFDPVFGRGYPDDMMAGYVSAGHLSDPDFIHEGDLEVISTPTDFLGLNYYTTITVRAGSEEREDPEGPVGPDPPDGFTEMGWAVDPDGLRDYLGHVTEVYAPRSVVVMENGSSYSDGPDASGRVKDDRRIAYLEGHIDAVIAARAAGLPVDGYFAWSLMDNVEWTHGFSQRFGLVWVDHESQERIPKDSFDWYAGVVRPDSPRSRALSGQD